MVAINQSYLWDVLFSVTVTANCYLFYHALNPGELLNKTMISAEQASKLLLSA